MLTLHFVIFQLRRKHQPQSRTNFAITCRGNNSCSGPLIYLRSVWNPGSPYRVLITALLVSSVAWLVIVHVQAIRRADEFYKQLHCRAMAIAFPTALILLFALGFFYAEGFLQGMDSRDFPMVLLITYAIGLTASYKHYQA